MRLTHFILFAILCCATTLSVAQLSLVKDINVQGDSFVNASVKFGSHVFFVASDGITGAELWKSDGSAEGTVLVKDINPGGGSDPSGLKVVGSKIFFWANDGTGRRLWKTDGTAAGTVAAVEMPNSVITESHVSTYATDINSMVLVNNVIYFVHDDAIKKQEIWRTDGTVAGTYQLTDFNMEDFAGYITAINDSTIFFAGGGDAEHNVELWKTNGTVAGTKLVKDLYPAAGQASWPQDLFNVRGTLYFRAGDGSGGYKFFRSDGTSEGTFKITDKFQFPVVRAVRPDGSMFLNASGGLWISDGTEAGTINLAPVGMGPKELPYTNLRGGTLYFVDTYYPGYNVDYPKYYPELWVSDGTPNGTRKMQRFDLVDGKKGKIFLMEVGEMSYFIQSADGYTTKIWSLTDKPELVHTENDLTVKNATVLGTKILLEGTSTRHGGTELYVYETDVLLGTDADAPNATQIFPNPFSDKFTVHISGETANQVSVEIHNSTGIRIDNFESVPVNTDLLHLGENWPKGMMTLRVHVNGKTVTRRVVKQ